MGELPPHRTAGKKKIVAHRKNLMQLRHEALKLQQEIEATKCAKELKGPQLRASASVPSLAPLKTKPRRKRGKSKRLPDAVSDGQKDRSGKIVMYNGKPIVYEKDPGRFGVSQGFDSFITNKTQVSVQTEGWNDFAQGKLQEEEDRKQEEEGKRLLEAMQQKSLRDVFDDFEKAHNANWKNHHPKPGMAAGRVQGASNAGQLDGGRSGRVQMEKPGTMPVERALAASVQSTSFGKVLKPMQEGILGGMRQRNGKQRRQRKKEENEFLQGEKLNSESGFTDSSKLHGCYRPGNYTGLNKSTYSLGRTDREANAVASLRNAEKQMRAMQKRQLKMARDTAQREAENQAMENARRWKHSNRARVTFDVDCSEVPEG
jgi:hypothetical protein